MMVATARKILTLGFFASLLINADIVWPAVLSLFNDAGSAASGINKALLNPDAIVAIGVDVAQAMLKGLFKMNMMDVLASAIPVAICAVAIVMGFTVMAGQLLLTLVEGYMMAGAGVIMLGFAGSRWTTEMSTSYLKAAVATGLKIMMTYLVLGAGLSFFKDVHVSASHIISDSLFLLAQAAVFTFLCWNLPASAAAIASGAPSSTLGGAVGAAMTMGAAIAGVAGAVRNVGGAAVESLREASGNGGDSRDALAGGPGSISNAGGFGGSPGMDNGGSISGVGGTQSGVGPAYSQPPGESATPTLPTAARDAQGGGTSTAVPGGGAAAASAGMTTAGSTNSTRGASAPPPDLAGASTGGPAVPGMTGAAGGNMPRESAPHWATPAASASDDAASASGTGTSAPLENAAAASPGGNASQDSGTSAPQGDASSAGLGASEDKKNDDKDKPGQPPKPSWTDTLNRAKQNLVHNDGASVQVGGIAMSHGKD